MAVEGFHVGLGGLGGRKTQGQQRAGGIVDEDDEGAMWPPPLEPVVRGTVDLDQFAQAGPARAALVDACLLACPGFPEPFGDHPLTHCLDGDPVVMTFGQLLAGQGGAEIGIAGANQVENLAPARIADPVVGVLAPVAGNQSGRTLGPVSPHQTLDLAHTQTQLAGRLLLLKLFLHDQPDDPGSIDLLAAHRNVLLCHVSP